jgi:tRNA threonylcarbamoyladenosine biosynthesis protein TsaE
MNASERERRRRRIVSFSAEDTEALGAEIAAGLGPGDVVVVSGDLGAGKTTLIRGACRALGVEGPVTSPTFTIGHRYRGRMPVAHLDLYRLQSLEGEDSALLDDYVDRETVAFIEWPTVAQPQLSGSVALELRLGHAGGDRREIELTWPDGASQRR